MIIDVHSHLQDEKFENPNSIVAEFENNNIAFIIDSATNKEDNSTVLNFANKNKKVYCTLGFHPEFADEVSEQDFSFLMQNVQNEKVVAIGEIGLDFYWRKDNKEQQKKVFISQLKLANSCKLPIVVHMRECTGEMLELLTLNKSLLSNGGVIHCFSGSKQVAEQLLTLGFYISVGGTITYKKNNLDAFNVIPIDRILTETDCPYLAPEPVRGSRNEPKNVKYVIKKLSEIYNLPCEEIEEQIIKNAKSVFKKIK